MLLRKAFVMAIKSDHNVGKPAKGRPSSKSPAAAAEQPKQSGGAKGLLRAGLKALGDVRDDVVLRQSRVFEALLGIDTSHAVIDSVAKQSKRLGTEGQEALGLHKFEAIFDQRVALSLERLGVPSPEALANLVRQLEAINRHLQRIEAPTQQPSKKRTRTRRSTKP
jgi:hypothetical protein